MFPKRDGGDTGSEADGIWLVSPLKNRDKGYEHGEGAVI